MTKDEKIVVEVLRDFHMGRVGLAREIVRLRAAWELCEEAAFMLLRTGGFGQEDRDRALTMLDRARAGGSPKDTAVEGSENG